MDDTFPTAVKRLTDRLLPAVAARRRTLPGPVGDRSYLLPGWLHAMTGADPATVRRVGLSVPGDDPPAARWSDRQVTEWLVWRWLSALGDRADVPAAAAAVGYDAVLAAARRVPAVRLRRAG